MPADGPTHDLRASDADREAAAGRLRTAAMEGRLEPAELDERMTAAYAARWCSELAALTADVTPPPAAPAPELARPRFVQPSQRTNGLAIASLVVSLVWMWWIGSVLAVAFGHIALGQIARSGQGGRGMAIAGLTIGYLQLAFLLYVMLTISF